MVQLGLFAWIHAHWDAIKTLILGLEIVAGALSALGFKWATDIGAVLAKLLIKLGVKAPS